MTIVEHLRQAIDRAIASGINLTLEDVLQDLQRNSPEKSGSLKRGWAITARASEENPTGTIENSQSYAEFQYPYRIYKQPNDRYPFSYPAPSIFSPKPSLSKGYGVMQPDQVEIEGKVSQAMEKHLREAL